MVAGCYFPMLLLFCLLVIQLSSTTDMLDEGKKEIQEGIPPALNEGSPPLSKEGLPPLHGDPLPPFRQDPLPPEEAEEVITQRHRLPPMSKHGLRPGKQKGLRPGKHKGLQPSKQKGKRPSKQKGLRPSKHKGLRPSKQKGLRPSKHKGLRPSKQKGLRPSKHKGLRPSKHKGLRPSKQKGSPPANQEGSPPGNQEGLPPADIIIGKLRGDDEIMCYADGNNVAITGAYTETTLLDIPVDTKTLLVQINNSKNGPSGLIIDLGPFSTDNTWHCTNDDFQESWLTSVDCSSWPKAYQLKQANDAPWWGASPGIRSDAWWIGMDDWVLGATKYTCCKQAAAALNEDT